MLAFHHHTDTHTHTIHTDTHMEYMILCVAAQLYSTHCSFSTMWYGSGRVLAVRWQHPFCRYGGSSYLLLRYTNTVICMNFKLGSSQQQTGQGINWFRMRYVCLPLYCKIVRYDTRLLCSGCCRECTETHTTHTHRAWIIKRRAAIYRIHTKHILIHMYSNTFRPRQNTRLICFEIFASHNCAMPWI